MLIIQTGFFFKFTLTFPASRGLSRRGKNERPLLAGKHLQKRASVESNNDNVYKFINTAKKTTVLGFL